MNLPSPYVCVRCGSPVNPKSTNTLRLSKAWLKGEGKSVAFVENEEFKYLHEWCERGYKTGGVQEEQLF